MDWRAVRARLRAVVDAGNDQAAEARHAQQVLERRAALLSLPLHAARESEVTDLLLVFEAAGARYAFRLGDVVEAIARPKLSPIPGAPPVVAGIMQVRGEIVPVYSLAALLGGTAGQGGAALLLRVGDKTAAVLVDALEGTRSGERPERSEDAALPIGVLWRTADLVSVLDAAQLIKDN